MLYQHHLLLQPWIRDSWSQCGTPPANTEDTRKWTSRDEEEHTRQALVRKMKILSNRNKLPRKQQQALCSVTLRCTTDQLAYCNFNSLACWQDSRKELCSASFTMLIYLSAWWNSKALWEQSEKKCSSFLHKIPFQTITASICILGLTEVYKRYMQVFRGDCQ